jgi:TRAP-type C4-dicarboxylate transport system substrate-binding protein
MTVANALAQTSGRRIALGALAFLAALPWCASGASAAEYTLRLSSWGSPTAPQVADYVPAFKKLVEEGSKGRIEVQAFPAGALVKEQDVPSAIQSRVVDISLSTIGAWSSVSPVAVLINSVAFRPTEKNFEEYVGAGSKLFKALDASLRKRHVVLLSVLDNGPPMVVSHDKITSPKDFKGKSTRVFDKASAELIHTLGGAPSTMPVSDVYPALQRGTVQAAIGGIQGITGLKEYEVVKHLLDGNGVWGVGVTLYVMNGGALDGLPPDLQQVVLKAGASAEKSTNEAIFAFFKKARETLSSHGMELTVLQPGTPGYAAFAEALKPLAKKQEAKMPADLVHLVAGESR